jgi:acetoacetyl-CoA synthase
VQHLLGAVGAAAFAVDAVCFGEAFALASVEGALAQRGGHVLVFGADLYSRILKPAGRGRTSCSATARAR